MSLISLLDNKKDHIYLLDRYDKKTLALRACRCAERVLQNFESLCDDERPRQGLEICYQWMKGEKSAHECRYAALATHAAAREMLDNDAACFAARAVGQAISAPHVTAHAIAAMGYARKSIYAIGGDVQAEYEWQMVELENLKDM